MADQRLGKDGMDDKKLERLADRLAEKLEERRQCSAPRLMDIAETARYLGRSTTAIQHMINRRTFPITKLDTKVQVDRVLLDKLINARTI
jgi:hypothetical protein